ncbi:MAG TPA: HlyD family type I secretion periplasmic adaptor subunit, partial [Caulobacteraceae bacterium]|nr:HlyD family type I secretion periplasmic adaptor subunit [Caulobacteraceae bacterium]
MPQLPLLARRERTDLITAPISAFESETQAVIQKTSPYSQHAIMHVLLGMVVLALVMMSVVKLDRVVTGTGLILPTQGSFFVQPLDRAIVTGILAHPGDVVRKGQVLATLDPTFAQADLKDLQQKASSAQALVARLKAEQAGKVYVADPASPDSVLQASIFAQRHAEYMQSINDFDARIASDDSVIARNRQNTADYQQRANLASQAEQTQVELAREGFGRKLSLLSSTDARLEMQRMASESQNAAVGAQHDAGALAAQRAVFVGKWRDDIATQLVTAQNQLTEATQALAKAAKVSDLSKLVSPANAVVLKVGKASMGSVIEGGSGGGDPLFTLTPLGGPVDAEVRIDAKQIGFIRPGDKVRVKLDAYRYTSHGLATGVIKSISDGSFSTTDDGQIVPAYYKARIAITNAHLRNVPSDFSLVPGLTITGDVLVGRRTILSYL